MPQHRRAVRGDHGGEQLAKLGREHRGELAVGLLHFLTGVEAIEIAALHPLHYFPHQGLVALIENRDLDHLERQGVGQAVGFLCFLRGGAQVNEGGQPQLRQRGEIRGSGFGEVRRAIEFPPLYLAAVGGGIAAQVAQVVNTLEIEQAVGIALFRG